MSNDISTKDRYGILLSEHEMTLLIRGLKSYRDNVKSLLGNIPKDLNNLISDIIKIKNKGYVETNGNKVYEQDMKGMVTCNECD